MMSKRFALDVNEIISLAPGRGSCLASDRITVDGCRVGFMYREQSDNDIDSGWRFSAGDESDEYANNPANFELYDINTIANYDPEIVQLLDAPVGSAFIRSQSSGKLEAVNH